MSDECPPPPRQRHPDNGSTTAVPQAPLAIVAIGASAGGLRALETFFHHVPGDSRLAFVVVVHLSPEHQSALDDVLQPHIAMPVQQVTESVMLERNRVYIIPPNANLELSDTHLHLVKLETRRHDRAPIDHFFRALADSRDGNAIGVILSGTGSDGTQGLRKLKEQGGLTIVQDPNEAEYDGMPRSAISGSPVDLVLPVAQIPDAILRFVNTEPQLHLPKEPGSDDEEVDRFLLKVFAQVRARTGRDFSAYKRSTLLRRLHRRMQFHQVQEPNGYIELLRKDPNEVHALADDLLITVTSFFRDPEVFELLEERVIPQLFDGKGPGDSVRVWSVACATGEEAYSLAMLLLEEASRHELPIPVQIFATDLHRQSLEIAREGYYTSSIAADVSHARLERFFHEENGGYRIRREVRELVVFAPHNVLGDPPFSHLDLISCRNLLIYLRRGLQHKVAELFHYALEPHGFVVVGGSETLGVSALFHVEDKKHGIYRKRNVPAPEPRLPVFPMTRAHFPELPKGVELGIQPIEHGLLHQRMMEHYGPASVLVSPDDRIVHFSGRAGRYLVHPGGPPTTSVYKLVREELRIELRAALPAARTQRDVVRSRPVDVRFNGKARPVVILARPVPEPQHESYVLVIFEEREPPLVPPTPPGEEGEESSSGATAVRELEAENLQTQERLQAIIRDYETSQEELRASNEELQSANEELRSTMEELETGKEELQSMNEELQTVNQENRHRMEDLDQLSRDLQHLFAATDIATLFLDREQRIMRFTPKIGELFNVRPTDRGRPLSDFSHRLGYTELSDDVTTVLEQLTPIEREVQDEEGEWYLTRLLPYRSAEDRIGGVVITFVNITERRQVEREIREAKEYAEHIIETLPEPLLVLTSELEVHSANPAFYEQFHLAPAETKGRKVYDLGNGQWDIPSLRELLEDVLQKNETFSEYQVEQGLEGLGHRVMRLNGRRLDHLQLILLGIHDITEQYEAEQALRASEEQRYRALFESIDEGFCIIELLQADTEQPTDYRYLEVNPAFEKQTGLSQAIGRRMRELVPDHEEEWFHTFGQVARTGEPVRFQRHAKALGRHLDVYAFRIGPPELQRVAVLIRDITKRKQLEDQLRAVASELSEANIRKDEYLAMLGHELRNPLAGIRSAAELVRLVGSEDPRLHQACNVLDRQSAHMARIVDGLIDVARIAKGKVRLELEPVDVRTILEPLLHDRSQELTTNGLQLESALPSEPLWIRGDKIRLAQVFDNLIGNAMKFTHAPGTITVTLEHEDPQPSDESEMAVVRVRDTGVGIRPEMLSRVFETFHQEPQDPARTAGGLGLGLALSRTLVELHRGSIQANSDGLGKGTEFQIRLPLVHAPADPPSTGAVPEVPPCRILVVEDNTDAAEMLRELLQLMGHRVSIACNGPAALDTLRTEGAEVVLCDLGLPGMSGYDLARAIRDDASLPDVRLVAVTGYGQPADRQRTAEAGFDEHLTKPVSLEVLTRVLDGVLGPRA